MRVRISYSVDLEEVPEKSGMLLKEAYQQLDECSMLLKHLASDVKSGTIEKQHLTDAIEQVRIMLGKIDSGISDASMIMSGYHDTKEKIENLPEETGLSEGEYGAD